MFERENEKKGKLKNCYGYNGDRKNVRTSGKWHFMTCVLFYFILK